MNKSVTRRDFAKVVAAGIGAFSFGVSAMAPTLTRRFFDGDLRKIGLQLYTLGDRPQNDIDAAFTAVTKIGYRDIELPGLYGHEPAMIRAAAERNGLTISSLHLGANPQFSPDSLSLLSEASQIGDALSALGVSQAVLPIPAFPPSYKPGADDFLGALARSFAEEGAEVWKKTAALLNQKAAALKAYGITLGYHNHNIEFAPIGDTSGWEILATETDPNLVFFEVDTAWLAAAGMDPVAFLQAHAGRARWLHVKDLKPSSAINYALAMDPVEVGAGKLDWQQILPAAERAGVKHYFVEQEPPFAIPREEAISRSYGYLDQLRVTE